MRNHLKEALALLSVGTFLLTGCDRLTATVQAASIVTGSPAISEMGLDPTLTAILPATTGDLGVTAVLVAANDRGSITSSTYTPITGADVSVGWTGGTTVSACEELTGQPGTYAATSIPNTECGTASLQYVPNVEYTTEIETASETYQLRVTAPQGINPSAVTFSPALGTASISNTTLNLDHHDQGEQLVVDWSADTAASERKVFATLFRINYTGANDAAFLSPSSWQVDANNPVFDTAPHSAEDALGLLTGSTGTSATIPASAFGQKGLYLLIITAAELSTDTSSNLGYDSGALAGKGIGFGMWVD